VQTLDARLAAEGGASRAEPLFASFGVRTVGPERIASIGLDRLDPAGVCDIAGRRKRTASGTKRSPAQKTKPGEPQDRSRLVRAGDAPAALPALPAPAGLPLLDVDTQFMAELDLAPLLSTLHKPPESNGGWYGLRERLAHLGLAQSFDALLCLPHLRGIESFWYQIETVPASMARSPSGSTAIGSTGLVRWRREVRGANAR